jgi:uncharacterized protein YbjT (DUF2867 family)
MRVAIVGGTGTLGRQVTEELRARGHEARVISRNAPEYRVDLTTGAGLDDAVRDPGKLARATDILDEAAG